MADFKFIQNEITGKWVVLAPRRSNRPDAAKVITPICPFCPGREKEEPDVYRIGGQQGDSNWQTRVIPNKFPFADIHEVVIHSPDHHKNFDELPVEQVRSIVEVYRQRFNFHKQSGQVYIFHNKGEGGGESLPHPHSQLVVVPNNIKMDIPPKPDINDKLETNLLDIFCPSTSQWPDEIWISPKKPGFFGGISDEEVTDLATALSKIIRILDLRHGHEFPFNLYINPGEDWYLRIIPRFKTLGGFEVGAGIYVNTQDPADTLLFVKEHFSAKGGPASGWDIDEDKIKREQKADYQRSV